MQEHHPLRVLHVIHSLVAGGAETQLRLLLNIWPYPDVKLAVFYLCGSAADITNPDVRLYASAQRSTRHPGYLSSLYRAIHDFDPDVIHTWLPPAVIVPAMLIGWLQRRQIIVSYRGRRSLSEMQSALEAACTWLCADRIVANHEVLGARNYQRSVFRWLYRRKHGRVIRNAIAVAPLVPMTLRPKSQAPFRFVCVGRLTPPKNYPRLVQALDLLPADADWSLDIWGEGESRPECERAIAECRARDRVRLRGNSPAAQQQMLQASALILPSISEGMPNVLLEAMALGVPVIAADIEGIREVVGGAPACIWVDPLDPRDMARGIASFMTGHVDVAALTDQGRRIADRFSSGAALSAYHELYRDLQHAR